jgi:hypothetical protein
MSVPLSMFVSLLKKNLDPTHTRLYANVQMYLKLNSLSAGPREERSRTFMALLLAWASTLVIERLLVKHLILLERVHSLNTLFYEEFYLLSVALVPTNLKLHLDDGQGFKGQCADLFLLGKLSG